MRSQIEDYEILYSFNPEKKNRKVFKNIRKIVKLKKMEKDLLFNNEIKKAKNLRSGVTDSHFFKFRDFDFFRHFFIVKIRIIESELEYKLTDPRGIEPYGFP